MITKEFELHVEGFAKSPLSSNDLKANFALGLAGESGEVADLIKKHLYHGLALDRAGLVLELGDLLWYWVALTQAFDLSPSEIMAANIAKLQSRHGGTSFDRAKAAAAKGETLADLD